MGLGWVGEERPREGHREAPPELEKKHCPSGGTLLPPETSWGHPRTWALSWKMNLFSNPFLGRGGWVTVALEAIGQGWQGAPQRPQAGLSRGGKNPGHAHHSCQPGV